MGSYPSAHPANKLYPVRMHSHELVERFARYSGWKPTHAFVDAVSGTELHLRESLARITGANHWRESLARITGANHWRESIRWPFEWHQTGREERE
jgi:hypothetical protein